METIRDCAHDESSDMQKGGEHSNARALWFDSAHVAGSPRQPGSSCRQAVEPSVYEDIAAAIHSALQKANHL